MKKGLSVAVSTLCLLVVSGAGARLLAQEEGAAKEPGTLDTLMEQSSAGNTAQSAQEAYFAGKRELDRADKLAAKALQTEDAAKAEKLQQKSVQAYESAVQQLVGALKQNPKNIDCYDTLGQAFRRIGKYQEAMQIHAMALSRDPQSMENFRGWSESLMGLDMLGNATTKYVELAEENSPYAPVLMDEMKKWLAAKQADPGDIKPEDVQRLADWIAAHEQSS